LEAIVVEDLWKRYIVRSGFRGKRVVEALRGLSFSVERGSVHALLGPNGAGKTTTVRILATLLLPDSGRAEILGMDVVREAPRVRQVIGVVLDVSKGFYMSLSGYENLVFYGLLKNMSLSDARRRAREVLELVGLEQEGAAHRPYYSYSLGMRARLAIAKALLTDPEVLILDEPTLGLDVESARAVRKLMVELARSGKTILVTGHNMYEIEMIADRVTIINRGRAIASGTPAQLKERLGLLHRLELRVSGDRVEDFVRRLAEALSAERIDRDVLEGALRVRLYARRSREEIAQQVFELAKAMGVRVLDIAIQEPTLEDAFIAIVEGEGSGVHSLG